MVVGSQRSQELQPEYLPEAQKEWATNLAEEPDFNAGGIYTEAVLQSMVAYHYLPRVRQMTMVQLSDGLPTLPVKDPLRSASFLRKIGIPSSPILTFTNVYEWIKGWGLA